MEIKFDKVCYIGDDASLKNVSFTIEDNTISAFVGKSGSGRSIILELINLLKFPKSGDIKLGNHTISSKRDLKRFSYLRSDMGILFQNASDIFFMDTVRGEMEYALNNFNYSKGEKDKRIKEALDMMGLDLEILDSNPFELSFGQQRKLALAIIFAFEPELVLLDEPTLGLDSKSRRQLIQTLRAMKKQNKQTIVIVSDDTDMLLEVVDKVYVLSSGNVVKQGDKFKIFSDYDMLYKYNINIPKLSLFSHFVKDKKEQDIGVYDDINDLIKDVYRNVK